MAKKSSLTAIPNLGATVAEPPANLGSIGLALWRKVMREYDIPDCAGLEFLGQACAAADRAAALGAAIDRDGATFVTSTGAVKAHPALRDELANRNFVIQTLQKLGLTLEPLKAPGRPPGLVVGWKS